MSYLLYRIGFALRETGQALDRVGCRIQGIYPFAEDFYRHRTVQNLLTKKPQLGTGTFVAPSASVVGDVSIGANSSVWYGTVLRGDGAAISIGSNTNLQDGVTIRTAPAELGAAGAVETTIGDRVSIAHSVTMHGVTVEDEALIGIGATLMNGVTVEQGSIVAAGAVVQPGTVVASGQLWGGNPARYLRDLKPNEQQYLPKLSLAYTKLAGEHDAANPKTLDDLVHLDLLALKA